MKVAKLKTNTLMIPHCIAVLRSDNDFNKTNAQHLEGRSGGAKVEDQESAGS